MINLTHIYGIPPAAIVTQNETVAIVDTWGLDRKNLLYDPDYRRYVVVIDAGGDSLTMIRKDSLIDAYVLMHAAAA